MSILVGPFEENTRPEHEQEEEDEDFLVFGYSCKLYRDDAKALLEDSGALLIPWMGDSSLMIDRYDVRNRLDDKNQFGLKSNLPYKMSTEEEEMEEMMDKERYLSLDCDILEEELREEEEEKRKYESLPGNNSFHAVGYSYTTDEYGEEEDCDNEPSQPSREYLTTSSVDVGEDDVFLLPQGLSVPGDIRLPSTNKVHSIIERTAQFVCQQGQQMEIIIKTKQKNNPYFSFLDHDDLLNPYYRHMLQAVSSKSYLPKQASVQMNETESKSTQPYHEHSTQGNGWQSENKNQSDDSGSEDSDEEGYELHPLLRGGRGPSPASRDQDATSKVLSAGEPGHAGALYKQATSINLAPAVGVDSHCDPTTRGATAGLDPALVQHHGSADIHGRGLQAAQYFGDDPYSAYCYQMQLAEYQYNLQAYYQAMSSQGITGNGPTPPPPDVQPIVDKTAEYVAKNEEGFERTVLDKHCDDPKFSFLNPWNQYHAYYQMKKEEFRRKRKLEEVEKENALSRLNAQRLSASGAVSFKLAIKGSKPLTPRVDLNVEEEEEEEGEEVVVEDGGRNGLGDKQEAGYVCNAREPERESEPAAKRPRCSTEEEEKMDTKVQEFLSRVKQMFNTD